MLDPRDAGERCEVVELGAFSNRERFDIGEAAQRLEGRDAENRQACACNALDIAKLRERIVSIERRAKSA